ncbi:MULTISPECIES: LysM peptidoglycan-binding domain-containing protein [unclassified Streptomyces]|uniref:LysM peptidoglycan-binding domain-containing protein n=1 Tax=unclassified Streptomyces TaxID=2593676 RepID=UPI0023654550|nr:MULTISPECIES: LysM peptidoglycan-binding domain-containing protein [unclassified Streptomyces]MDF3141070.1 LysM peptidoglycan-binding domain-containing protein [Streptomyces sp. T21Q-yed]WDF45055.1 LysM peptidoglycan-binding domain-containing protein [Streptomyces sp. T12]
MSKTRSRSTAPTRRGSLRLLRALASAIVLCALVVGLPWLLWEATTAIWDSGSDAFTHLLTRQDTGSAFMLALCIVGWISWASFVLSLLLEIPAQLRGRSAPRLPGLGVSQRAAATLVGGILMLFTTSTALASAATPAQAVPTVSASHAPGHAAHTATPPTDQSADPAATRASTADPAQQTYTVRDTRPAESLWSIAEDLYGDGALYTKIADANEGRRMADGNTFHANAPIQPGWVLHVPDMPTAGPSTQTDHTQPADAGATSYTVRSGDTMWGIAEDELGDGSKYTEIFDENRGASQPGGTALTDPDEIRPGLKLDIPHATAPSDQPDGRTDSGETPSHSDERADTDHDQADDTAPDEGDTGAAPRESAHPDDQAATPATPTPHATEHDQGEQAPPAASPTPEAKKPSATPSASASAQPSTPAPSTSTTPDTATPAPEATGESDEAPVGVGEAAGIGLLLAGSLIATVGVKRLLQRRRRRPGETIAMPEEPGRLEQVLEAGAEPEAVDLLDAALRTLAHHAAEQGRPLPAIRGARATSRAVDLLIDHDPAPETQPPIPFTQASDGRWTLDAAHPLLDADQARDTPAPYPGLVTLGTHPDDGSHLLLNLATVRVLLLDGDATAVRDTARVIALDAATSTWSDHAEILTVGLDTELPARLPKGRLRTVPHLRAAQSDLGDLLLTHHQHAPAEGDEQPDPLPWMLICAAETTTPDEARHLADALTAARHLPVALVLPAEGASDAFPDAVRLTVGSDTPQHLDVLDSDLIVQYMTDEEYREFLEVLQTADEPARSAEGPWQLVPPVSLDKPAEPSSPPAPPYLASPTAVPDAPFTALSGAAPPASVRILAPVPPPDHSADDPDAPAPTTADARELSEPAELEEEPADAIDLHAPEVQVLGPVSVTGIEASGHGLRISLLAALLYFKPGCSTDTAREAMDPRNPWSKTTLQTRISELRNRLGNDADGNLYLPRDRTGTYRLSPKVRCDWTRFTQLAERGLHKGPTTGIADLEAALALVRGRPFAGTDPTWAATRIQEMLVRIVDVAHTLATWHRTAPRPDIEAARRAVRIGIDVDDSAEILYQDWMLLEDAAGNRDGVRTAYDTIRDLNRRLDVEMEAETDRVFDAIMSRSA